MNDATFPHHGEAEEWRPVVGYEGLYQVSDLGRVRSLDHIDSIGRHRTGRMLSRFPGRDGYLRVGLSDGPKRRHVRVHRLVLEVFRELRPEGMEARHLNGDRLDNRAANLLWGTKSENSRDQLRHGTHHQIVKTHCPQGHEYTPENTYITVVGGRQCLTCERVRGERRRHPAQPKTHCKWGHEFTPENTYEQTGGYRGCLECKRQRDREGTRRRRREKQNLHG